MSAMGYFWDNAIVESFVSTTNHELELHADAEHLCSTSNCKPS